MLQQENDDNTLGNEHSESNEQPSRPELDGILFRNDCMYSHKIMRINFTTYDVRRSQDVIHTGTTHCNIMVLSDPRSSESSSKEPNLPFPFVYGRVLGIYHVNVIYNGPGMLDYRPRRINFLWVRWYEPVDSAPMPWKKMKLDRVRFSPVNSDDAFGFLDPSDVVRTCHIIPRLATGRVTEQRNSQNASLIAKSMNDYKMYYINR
jgi:hypothetical protein